MKMLAKARQRDYQILIALILIAVVLAFWKPQVLVFGLQRGGLYALIALPMALMLGIVGILNLAHGNFMMIGAYLAYQISISTGIDPLMAIAPACLAMLLVGIATYRLTFKPVLKAPRLNQFLLTFGVAMVLSETVNLIWSSRSRNVIVGYAAPSATIGDFTFGTFGFVYVAAAIIVLVGLLLFLTRTRAGKAALAVGQNPRGAKLVGIDIDRTYLLIVSIAIALVGAIGGLFLIRNSIFPQVGVPYNLRSVSLVVMAGFGNLTGILWWGIALGLAEAFVKSFKGIGGWSDMIFFALIIVVIMVRSHKRQVT